MQSKGILKISETPETLRIDSDNSRIGCFTGCYALFLTCIFIPMMGFTFSQILSEKLQKEVAAKADQTLVFAQVALAAVTCLLMSAFLVVMLFYSLWIIFGRKTLLLDAEGFTFRLRCLFWTKNRRFTFREFLRLDKSLAKAAQNITVYPTLEVVAVHDRLSLPCRDEVEYDAASGAIRRFLEAHCPSVLAAKSDRDAPADGLYRILFTEENGVKTITMTEDESRRKRGGLSQLFFFLGFFPFMFMYMAFLAIESEKSGAILAGIVFMSFLWGIGVFFLLRTLYTRRCFRWTPDGLDVLVTCLSWHRDYQYELSEVKPATAEVAGNPQEGKLIRTVQFSADAANFVLPVSSEEEQRYLVTTINAYLAKHGGKPLSEGPRYSEEPLEGSRMLVLNDWDAKEIRIPMQTQGGWFLPVLLVPMIALFVVAGLLFGLAVKALMNDNSGAPLFGGAMGFFCFVFGLLFFLGFCQEAGGKYWLRLDGDKLGYWKEYFGFIFGRKTISAAQIQNVETMDPIAQPMLLMEMQKKSIACKYFVLVHYGEKTPLIVPCHSAEDRDWLAEAIGKFRERSC